MARLRIGCIRPLKSTITTQTTLHLGAPGAGHALGGMLRMRIKLYTTLTFSCDRELRDFEESGIHCCKSTMTSQTTVIPGLFSSEQPNLSTTTAAPSLFSGSATSVNTNANTTDGADRFIHLRGSGLIIELTNEKDNLDARFVHSKRLIDEGKALLCVSILIDAHRPFVFQKLPGYSAVEPSLLPLILILSRLRKSTSRMIAKKRY